MAKKTPTATRNVRAHKRSETLKEFCRTLPGVTEDIKWDDHLVFSVGGKMFALFDAEAREDDPARERGKAGAVRFICEDDDFDRLIELPGVIPSPYLTRFGWVRVERDAKIPMAELRRLIVKGHGLVLSKLPKRTQQRILGA